MRVFLTLLSLMLIIAILVEGFETVVQPRRVTRKYRISRFYHRAFWALWRSIASAIGPSKRRAAFLSAFGPLSLLGNFAIWVTGLVFGFALLHWSLHDPLLINVGTGQAVSFRTCLYLSGTTFFTLGYGDVTPGSPLGRALAVIESGLGFGFLAAILSYLPALFQAYSKREVTISLLDARAGSPPSASQLLLRAARAGETDAISPFLLEWERWAAELLESQLSFPVLAYYRSQHDNQSWLAALATVLDASALLMTQVSGVNTYQAEVTFAIARHAAVDLTLVLGGVAPKAGQLPDRLPGDQYHQLLAALQKAGVAMRPGTDSEKNLVQLRSTYEPFLQGLAEQLLVILPPVVGPDGVPDNWQRSAWMKPTPGIGALPTGTPNEEHFG